MEGATGLPNRNDSFRYFNSQGGPNKINSLTAGWSRSSIGLQIANSEPSNFKPGQCRDSCVRHSSQTLVSFTTTMLLDQDLNVDNRLPAPAATGFVSTHVRSRMAS